MDSATLTKFLDFVSFDVRHVPGSKKFFEKFQNITRRQRGDPSKTETRAESAPPPAYNVIPEPSPDRVNPHIEIYIVIHFLQFFLISFVAFGKT